MERVGLMRISRKMRSRRRTCIHKVKLDLTEAPAYLLAAQKDTVKYQNPEDLELYLCGCGWLHIGHKLGSKTNPVKGEEKNVQENVG
jgi:hypothetical protein